MKISEDQSINESFGPKRLKNEVLVALRNLRGLAISSSTNENKTAAKWYDYHHVER